MCDFAEYNDADDDDGVRTSTLFEVGFREMR